MNNANDTKAIEQLCLISRRGVCILDMQQVKDTAEAMNLSHIANIIKGDLDAGQITTGRYFPIVKSLYGA